MMGDKPSSDPGCGASGPAQSSRPGFGPGLGNASSADAHDLASMDYRSVGRHNSETSAYVVYEGLVYDITGFLRRHPGGKSILLAALGTDVTETLDSFHDVHVSRLIRSEQFRNANGVAVIARLERTPSDGLNLLGNHDYQSRREYRRPDPMGDELRRQVMSYLRRTGLPTKKSLTECLVLLVLFYGLYATAVYMAFIQGSPLWCLLMGPIATFMAVNVGHTVMHGGFSNSRIVNILGRSLWDAGGYASCCWDVEHQGHHQAPHTTIDLQTAGSTGMRFFEHQKFERFHRYQMFYMWIVFVFYSPASWVMHSYRTLFVYPSVLPWEKALHIGFKSFGFVVPITLSFFLSDIAIALGNLALFALSMSYFSLFTLFIQHEDSYLPEDKNEPWSVRQVTTSVSWRANSRLFEWLFGYFNYHTEHHLFPGLNPSLYPKIQPIVKSVCEKYGVRYKHISYLEMVCSQVRAWRKYSMAEIVLMTPEMNAKVPG
jgi:fatty acid desaturase/predicted heme/steroid binding protein